MPAPSPTPAPLSPPVRTTTRLWSAEVNLADAGDPPPLRDDAYRFSNGRRFVGEQNPYEPE